MKKTVRPDNITWPDDWSVDKDGMTQSMYQAWLGCRRALMLYLNGYYKPGPPRSTHFGSMAHYTLEKVFATNKIPTSKSIITHIDNYTEATIKKGREEGVLLAQDILEFEAAKAEATMIQYFRFYEEDFKTKKFEWTEHLFEVMYNGVKHRGKIDARYRTLNKKKWLDEHKTKSQIREDVILKVLNLDFQNQFYIVADEIETGETSMGMLYDIIRNTKANLLKGQTLLTWKNALSSTIEKDPEHFFKRFEAPYTPDQIKIFKGNLTMMTNEVKNPDTQIYPNPCSCGGMFTCEYLDACSSNSCASLSQKTGTPAERMYHELKVEETKDGNKKVNRKNSVEETTTAKRIKRKRKN